MTRRLPFAAFSWPEGTHDYNGVTYRIRGISTNDPDYIRFIWAPYYIGDEGTLAEAVAVIRAETRLNDEQARQLAKALGLARRPADLPEREASARHAAAAVIMGTLADDGTSLFGYRPGAGIDGETADQLRRDMIANDLGRWANAILVLSIGALSQEDLDEGKASSVTTPITAPSIS